MACCCVPFWKSQSGKSNVSFHEFPSKENLRGKWITTISHDETDEGDTEEQGKRRQCPSISYDTSLPVQHTYLGSNLEELSGRTVLDDNSCQTIPLLTLPGVVLVPGQTLPLQLFHPATVSMMMHIIQSDRTFGLINSRYSGRTFGDFIDALGTTAEIRSYHEEGNDSLGLSTLRIKAEGRQRFLVLETRQQPDGMVLGKVRIMPESVLGDPGEGARLESLNRFRHLPPQPQQHDPEEVSVRPQFDPYSFAHLAHWPAFVYKLYDPTILMRNIKSQLHGWNDSLKTDYMPSDAREFSYWVAANLPLNDKQRLSLLSENNYIQRLRKVMEILESVSVLRCRDCHAVVADRKDIFSMSLQGPQGTYVNANGYVHEAITLYHVEGIYLVGRPSTVQSWFPGYAWRIGECENCRSHMGWKFNAVDKKLQPNKFWALCRSSITGVINVPFN